MNILNNDVFEGQLNTELTPNENADAYSQQMKEFLEELRMEQQGGIA